MRSLWSPARAAGFACALAVALVTPASAQASYHLAHVNELMSSIGGDTTAKFVELTDPDEPFPSSSGPYKLIVYNGAGTEIGQQTLSQTALAAFTWGRPYLISTAAADTALGKTGDEVLTVPVPTGGGQVCFAAGMGETLIHCVAYGSVATPKPGAEIADAPPDGKSITRQSDGSWVVTNPTPGAEKPSATTSPATAVTTNGATLNGSVNPTGGATTYHFEYGTTTAYGTNSADTSAGSGSAASTVNAAVTGLTPGTTYHFRIVATSASGTANGADVAFTTAAETTGGGGGGGGTTPPPSGGSTTPADTAAPVVSVTLPAKRAIKNLLAVQFKTNEPGQAKGTVKLAGKAIGSGTLTYTSAGTKILKIKLTKVALRKLKKKKGFVRVAVTLVVNDVAGNKTTVNRTLRIRVSR